MTINLQKIVMLEEEANQNGKATYKRLSFGEIGKCHWQNKETGRGEEDIAYNKTDKT